MMRATSILHGVLAATALTCAACASDAHQTSDTEPAEGADASAPERDAGAPEDAANPFAALPVTVSGPISGGMGKPFTSAIIDLAAQGYREQEYFFEGEASAYTLVGEMSMDGRWQLSPGAAAHFKSRLLVRRPSDARKFNGSVVIEWLNVSGGADGDPGFMYNWQELLREGYAWVGVSAQATGVEGGGFALLPAQAVPLKRYDAERYGSLSHPGDAYSFDIFTRAAQIVRGAGGMDVLEGLKPERLIAYGESQSAIRMVSYVNGVHPLVELFDAFFIHSRSASAVSFGNETALPFGGAPVLIRDDIDALVFQFQTETDVLGSFGYLAARQPDSARLHTWEVAGTAHADAYILNINGGGTISCKGVNDGPQHFVIKAALHALQRWLIDGTPPVAGAPLMADAAGRPVLDEHGNTRGGVRSPDVDVPIATLSGQPAEGSSDILCSLFGHTTPFSADELKRLYPTHDDYVSKVRDAARAAREAKFLLEPEEQALVAEAQAAKVPM